MKKIATIAIRCFKNIYFILVFQKEKFKAPVTPVVPLKDREPVTWKHEKLELEKQVKELRLKYETTAAELKKTLSKVKE